MKLNAWQFVQKPVCDLAAPGALATETESFEKLLADPAFIGTYGIVYDFYRNGRVRSMGWQFEPFKENEGKDWTRIFVKREDEELWYQRYVPSTDPETIMKFVSAYERTEDGGEVEYFVRPKEIFTIV